MPSPRLYYSVGGVGLLQDLTVVWDDESLSDCRQGSEILESQCYQDCLTITETVFFSFFFFNFR